MRSWTCFAALSALLAVGCSADAGSDADTQVSVPEPEIMAPPGVTLPYVAEAACPGEGCTYGTWLACGPVGLVGSHRADGAPVRRLAAGDTISVDSGVVVVHAPGVVAVTRETERLPSAHGQDRFEPGDTVYVLDYLGEGFFSVWHEGSVVEAEVFWPWDQMYVGPEYEFGGEVVQAGRSEFWINASAPDGTSGWILVDGAPLAIPNSLDPGELVCY